MGIYPVPLPAEYFSAFSSCLDCCVWVAFPYSGSLWSSLLWNFLAVGGFVQVACQDFLVREACVSVLVDGAGFLLSGVQ